MTRYANQQLIAAEVIAELVEMAKEVVAEPDLRARFTRVPRSSRSVPRRARREGHDPGAAA